MRDEHLLSKDAQCSQIIFLSVDPEPPVISKRLRMAVGVSSLITGNSQIMLGTSSTIAICTPDCEVRAV
jgi:hypothetical protein